MIEWGGALRWYRTNADPATVREAARRAGGHATRFRGADMTARTAATFTPLPPVLARLHRELKSAFDPEGILNPGRMAPDF
jgi:glycolate oxidase FAD binding subunit